MMMEGSLKLANGEQFTGHWYGKSDSCTGDLIFFTGMEKLQEFITDPANKGKIVVATFPGILNRKLDQNRFESNQIQIAGFITQYEFPDEISFSQQSFMHAFIHEGVPILTGMDTRAIIKRIKLIGEMPAVMVTERAGSPLYKEEKAFISTEKEVLSDGENHIVVVDFGLKHSLLGPFIQRGFKVTTVPYNINVHELHSLQPNGVIFSGGPGSPEEWENYFPQYKKIAMAYPTIGVGLGHQIIALAFGATIEKMNIGHRSFKEPIVHVPSNQVFMSNQNHRFTVNEESLQHSGFQVLFKNVQDETIEALIHEQYNVKTYQFHPEGKDSPLNELIFKQFFEQMTERKGVAVYA